MRPKTKKNRRLKPPLLNVAKCMGKWIPSDDFLLIQSVSQLNDLSSVRKLTRFSRNFTLKEIKERWYAILYDGIISRLVYKKIKTIHSDDVLSLKRLAPFSDKENQLLLSLESTLETDFFNDFLKENRIIFHESRTVQSLTKQWNYLKDCYLLKDQKYDLERNNKSLEVPFEVLESRLSDDLIMEHVELNDNDEKEMKEQYDSISKEIKRTEADIFLWQALADKVTGRKNPFIEMDTIAVLFCEQTEFRMKSREITIGRASPNTIVDIDLSLIKQSKKISRIQCKICLIEDDLFYLFNKGTLDIRVNGEQVNQNEKIQIKDKSLIQIDSISLLFLVNYNNIPPQNSLI